MYFQTKFFQIRLDTAYQSTLSRKVHFVCLTPLIYHSWYNHLNTTLHSQILRAHFTIPIFFRQCNIFLNIARILHCTVLHLSSFSESSQFILDGLTHFWYTCSFVNFCFTGDKILNISYEAGNSAEALPHLEDTQRRRRGAFSRYWTGSIIHEWTEMLPYLWSWRCPPGLCDARAAARSSRPARCISLAPGGISHP